MEENKKNTETGRSLTSIGKTAEYTNKILCDCQSGKSERAMKYVQETDEPWRHEIYKVAKEHFDKAVYLLQAETGIHINSRMAEELAKTMQLCGRTITSMPRFAMSHGICCTASQAFR